MDRFLAIVGICDDATSRAQRLATLAMEIVGFHQVLDAPGLMVLAHPGLETRSLGLGHGVVLGRFFNKQFEEAPSQLDARLGERSAEILLEQFWGGYVAFIAQGSSGETLVVRDPSGALPCYHLSWQGLEIFLSDAALAVSLDLMHLRLSWDYVAAQLVFPQLRLAQTGANQVCEILAGTFASCSPVGVKRKPLWRPLRAAATIRTMSEAAAVVGEATRDSIVALARGRGPAAVRLSGGLDSSIVASILGKTANIPSCVNLSTPGLDGNEQRYARAVAETIAASLHVVSPEPSPLDVAQSPSLSFRPGEPAVLQGLNRALDAACCDLGAGVIFTGAGGDNVFSHLSAVYPATDRLLDQGPGPRFLQTAGAVAEIFQTTTWRVAAAAVRNALSRTRPRWRPDFRYLNAAVAPQAADVHPWLEDAEGVAPGRIGHVMAILRAQNPTDPANSDARLPTIHPLLTQPVMEACLRVPSWLWVEGGTDRAVARTAFQTQLPSSVLKRRGKGRLDSYCAEVYLQSRASLRALLTDGKLAGRGLLDLPAILAYLDRPGPPRNHDFYRIFELADLEAWMRTLSDS